MRNECLLFSDFEVGIDDSLLTSEPDINAANTIEQITEIALAIDQRIGSGYTNGKANFTPAERLRHCLYQPMWSSNVQFSGALLEGSTLVSSAQCVGTLGNKFEERENHREGTEGENNVEQVKATKQVSLVKTPREKKLTLRSKQGCWTCRLRHKACPEDGHPCGTCIRLGLECDVSRQRPSYMVDAGHTMQRLKEIRAITDKLRKQQRRSRHEKYSSKSFHKI